MPVTKIKTIHKNSAKSVKQTLKDTIKYITDQKKTTHISPNSEQFRLIETDNGFLERQNFEKITATEWDTLKKEYAQTTGRTQGNSDILAYHVIQSFDPAARLPNGQEEIDPETALKIGKEYAERITEGNYNYVIATHIDKGHIHNHIIINSTAIDATQKYRNIYNSYKKLQEINDKLCESHNIPPPVKAEESDSPDKKRNTSYKNWLVINDSKLAKKENQSTWQNILRQILDMILRRKPKNNCIKSDELERINKILDERFKDSLPKNLEEVIDTLKVLGYQIKPGNRKYISVQAPGQSNFTRLRDTTLGNDYSAEAIELYLEKNYIDPNLAKIIAEKKAKVESENTKVESKSPKMEIQPLTKINIAPHNQVKLRRLVDTTSAKMATNKGLQQWAYLQNVHVISDTISYLERNNFSFNDIKNMLTEHETALADLQNQKAIVDSYTAKQQEIRTTMNHIVNYTKLRKIFLEYKNGGYNAQFKVEHAEQLAQYDQARDYFNEYKATYSVEKMPTMKELKAEFSELKSAKNEYYETVKKLKSDIKNLQLIKNNVMQVLDLDENGNSTKTEKQRNEERKALIKQRKNINKRNR